MENEELEPLEVTELIAERARSAIDIRPDTNALAPLTVPVPADMHHAFVYLTSLSVGSHRTMTQVSNVTNGAAVDEPSQRQRTGRLRPPHQAGQVRVVSRLHIAWS